MVKTNEFISIKDATANPAPLGLLGFAMTTILLNIHNAGFFPINSMILAMGIFYGGLAQIIAGVQEWKKNNTFGATAFTSYGLFWISLVALLVMPSLGMGTKPSAYSMGFYLAIWGVLTLNFFMATLNKTKITMAVFGSLTILFFLLAISDFTGSATIKHIAGWEGILCGSLAFYDAVAQIINEAYGRTVLPVGEPNTEATQVSYTVSPVAPAV